MNSTRHSPGPFVVVLALAVSTLIARSSAFWRDVAATGGVVESVSDTAPRERMNRDQLVALLPAEHGPFTFPAPYNTRGVRLTGPADCDGTDCVSPASQASQRSLSNSAGSSTLYAVVTLRRNGVGATLFSIDKNSGDVTRVGPAFGAGNPLNDAAADNFSFSATLPTALYGHDTRRLFRHDVLAHAETTVVDLTAASAVAVFGPGRRFGHVTTDNSDAVHAFVLRDAVTNLAQGCGVYSEPAVAYSYFPSTSAFDDCTIDKSGRYLILFEGDATRVVDLQTAAEMSLAGGPGGSIGRGDTGYGYTVNEDARGTTSAAMTRWFLDRPFSDPSQRSLQNAATEWADQVTYFSHGNAVAGDAASQYGCSATTYLDRPTPIAREGELICYPLDGSLRVLVVAPAMTDVNGAGGRTAADRWTRPSLDPTGQFLMWTSNVEGSGRLDAFVVRVPAALLGPEPPATDIIAPEVHLANPDRSATLAGIIELDAQAFDNVGVTAIRFAVDGVSLGAQLDDGEFSHELDTTTLPDGIHFVTVTACDVAGNSATTPPVFVTVMNTPAGPQVATIAAPVVTHNSAIIEWTTTQLADTRVDFGLTSDYGRASTGSLDLSQRHLQVLTGLVPGTTYHYRLQSANPSGTATSDDLTLTTMSSTPDPSTLPGLADDGLSYPPPSTGDFAYNTFAPPLLPGATYSDPVFGTSVRRLTTDHEPDDIYARNMWWNADGTKYLHGGKVINVATGEITHVVPRGSSGSDAGFDPVDPNALYYYSENAIHRVLLSQTSADTTDSVFFQAPSEIWTLGGTINWFDASGRYFLVRYGPEPSIYLYDRFNLAAGPYANAVDASMNVQTGSYVGLSPDGQYLVGYESASSIGKGVSWKIDHASRSVGAANYFWSLCGDHGSFMSASDGRNYMVVGACLNFPEVWRVDITNNADGLNETQQKALPHNMRLIRWPTWSDEVHFTTVARGPFRDWAFVSLEDATDTFNTGVDAGGVIAPWRPYKQEIVAFHVLTGEIRRLVHHRSRSTDADYAFMPRLSASWAGEQIGWSSNFNDPAMVDVMTLSFGAAAPSVSAITASAITGTTATVTWTTDLLADSQVEYGTTTDYGSTTTLAAARMLSHQVGLTGLLPGTTYHYRVRSTTSAGLTSISADATFTTVAPPTLSGVSATGITSTTATISWSTDQASTAHIEYGLTSTYGDTTTVDTSLATTHIVPLTGLAIGATYHYRVISTNSIGLTTVSADFAFSTIALPIVSDVTVSSITGSSARISWTTDQETDTRVEYGLTSAYGSTTILVPALVTSHIRPITGLDVGTTYHFRVISTNSLGLTAMSADATFTTVGAPAISGVTATAVTGTSATIGWTTDQATSSRVEYGPTIAYGTLTDVNPATVTSHTQALAGLTPGTTYHYRVISTNSGDVTTTSIDFSFATVATPALSALTVTGITGNAATIGWTTDQATSSRVDYGLTTDYGSTTGTDPALVTGHGTTLSGLAHGTTYHYRVTSTNSVGLVVASDDATFTTVAVPTISSVTASAVTGSSATIAWTTDQPTTSLIEYGISTAYGSATTLETALTTAHSQALAGLAIGTTYHYRVTSTNGVGLVVTSDDATFTTVATPTISSVTASAVTGSSATIAWATNQATTSQVEYGTTTAFGNQTTLDSSLVTAHSQSLTGLNPGTTYFYRVRSTNDVGLLATSDTESFTTVALPVVSAVAATAITGTTATIVWTSDQPSSSRVQFGVTTEYGADTTLEPALVTAHNQPITGLQVGTTYHYRVISTNSVGLTTTSSDFTFTTVASPVLSTVTATAITGASATISWLTDQPTTSQVDYGTTTAFGNQTALDAALVTAHGQNLTGLNPGTTYFYRVQSTNDVGLLATSATETFTTVAVPVLSDIAATAITGSGVTIVWTSDQPTSSLVQFGVTTAYGAETTLDLALVTSHTQGLAGLQLGTTFHYRVISTNSVGLTTTSSDFTFTTVAVPVISSVTASAITTSSALVSWTSDQPASSQIEYGLSTAYGSTTALDAALTTAHSQALTTLAAGTTYHYRVTSTNGVGLVATSDDATFTTVAVPTISSVTASAVTGSSVTIAWTTNQATTSQVEYGTTTAFETQTTVDSSLVTAHSQNLTGLTPGTTYFYRVQSTNDVGLLATSAAETFTTVAAPVISNLTASAITGSSALVSWTTDQPATSLIEYGFSTAYGSTTTLETTLSTAHSQALPGLAIGTTYHYRVTSTNSVGLMVTSDDVTFTTVAVPTISSVTASAVTGSSATIAWTTNQTTTSQVEYGTTTAFGSQTTLDSSLVTAHSQSLTGLTPGTTYFYRVRSTNDVGLLSTSGIETLTTVAVPVISSVTASAITGSSALVSWTTDQPATSLVEYGLSTAYGTATTLETALTTAHGQALAGLAVGTTYHYRVISTNSVGLVTTSDDVTFTTVAVPTISSVTASAVTGSSATIAWTTNQATTSQVEYGTTTAFGAQTTLDSSLVTAHSQNLTGLTPGTTYFYQVHSTNDVGLIATSATATFTTVAMPVLSEVAATAITGSAATISWLTDQSTTSRVEYGLTSSYGSTADIDSVLVTIHSIALTGLAHGTTYHYRVISTNSVGLDVISGDATFTTVALPVISGVTSSALTGNGATISWTTDQPTSSQVEYGVTSAYGSSTTLEPALAASHAHALAGLTHGTTYHYRVRSVNSVGLAVTSADFTLTTVAPPVVAGVAALGVTGTSVTIAWTTDQPADSQIEYGQTSAYGNTSALDTTLVTNHAQPLTGLTPGAVYHFRVRSTNAVGLTTISADDTFTMVAAPAVSNVGVSNITGSSATFTWATDQAADSQIEFGTTSGYGSFSPLETSLTTSHTLTVTGLTPGTTYHFRVRSTNDLGLTSASSDNTFTTVAVPVISAITASAITGTTATISWTSDQPTTSRVEYGLTTAYGASTPLDAALVTSHSQQLTGLTPGATYHYRVTSANDVGLAATSADASFITVAAPVISDVAIAVVTGSAATIAWTTDQPANSQIEYGATTAFGNATALDTTLTTSHAQTISGLANGTSYHFRVRAANVHDTLSVSADGMFTTIAPSSISTVTVSNITPTSATIAWGTNQPTDAQVEYGPTTAYGTTSALQTALVTSHGVALNGLAVGTTYHYRVRSSNNVGLLAVSTDAAFTTVAAPSVSGVSAPVVAKTSATVVWATSQPADSVVEYGLTSAYGSATTLDATMVTSHAVGFSGLAADTTYHYRVTSRNTFGLSTVSADFTFKTAADVSESESTLTIIKNGPGTGTVRGPGTLDCGPVCTTEVTPGTIVTLTATAGPGAIFAGWSGACANAQPTCTLTFTTTASVTATFTRATSGDFDGDGYADLVWQHSDGTLALWTMQGTTRLSAQFITSLGRSSNGGLQLNADLALTSDSRVLDPNWHIVATPDLDGNGKADLLWQHAVTGELAAWIMERNVRVRAQAITPGAIDPSWHLQASSDLNGDGNADLLWHQIGTNLLAVWFMNGTSRVNEQALSPATVPAEWRLVGSADFDADGHLDLVWQSQTTGDTFLWYMDGTSLRLELGIGRFGEGWQARAVGDFDRDGHPDLIWQKSTGELAVWFMDGTVVTIAVPLSPGLVSAGWTIVGAR